MSDITVTKKFSEEQCIYLTDGFGNQFNILFGDSDYTDSCVRIMNSLLRSFSRLYFEVNYCGNPKCPCSAFYEINMISKEEAFGDVMEFINVDNKELFEYLSKVFNYYK